MSERTLDYHFELPQELIARYPLAQRQASRMLVLHRDTSRIEHRQFTDFPSFVGQEDCVVLNDTKVIPARAFSDDGRIELLFLKERVPGTWECMVKPGRKMRLGARITLAGRVGEVIEITAEGERVLAFDGPIDLEQVGQIPLPPYMGREAEKADALRYQTIYASKAGAVAAPTAGLHFTPEILAQVPHLFVTLHVGAGTFKPVQAELLSEHKMHSERFMISEEAAESIQQARRRIAVGTTCVRVLESCARDHGQIVACEGETDIFIHPPYNFSAVDMLLTNFHLPCSTLLMLISAFAGREAVLEAYAEAVRQKYRFYSYGDCMLIV